MPIYREISNEVHYYIDNMAKIDYEMPEKDKVGTQLLGSSNSFSQQTSNPAKRKTVNMEEVLKDLIPSAASEINIQCEIEIVPHKNN